MAGGRQVGVVATWAAKCLMVSIWQIVVILPEFPPRLPLFSSLGDLIGRLNRLGRLNFGAGAFLAELFRDLPFGTRERAGQRCLRVINLAITAQCQTSVDFLGQVLDRSFVIEAAKGEADAGTKDQRVDIIAPCNQFLEGLVGVGACHVSGLLTLRESRSAKEQRGDRRNNCESHVKLLEVW